MHLHLMGSRRPAARPPALHVLLLPWLIQRQAACHPTPCPSRLPAAPAEGGAFPSHSFACTTTVQFDELSPEAIAAYVASGEPFDKAGSYGARLQGGAGKTLCAAADWADLRSCEARRRTPAAYFRPVNCLHHPAPPSPPPGARRHPGQGRQLCGGHPGLLLQRHGLPVAPLWPRAGRPDRERRAAGVTRGRPAEPPCAPPRKALPCTTLD